MKTCEPKILFLTFFLTLSTSMIFADLLKDSIDFFSGLEKKYFSLTVQPCKQCIDMNFKIDTKKLKTIL